MTVAWFVGVMATVFRVRWLLTLFFLELLVRGMLLSALFTRSSGGRGAKVPLPGIAPYGVNPGPVTKIGL
jgi:hypothetical protein